MDEGGDVPGHRGKDCSTCRSDGIQIKAEVFCDSCDAFFCPSCSSLHQRLLRQHQTTEIDEGRLVDKHSISHTSILSEVCQHHTKSIDFYCVDHDEVGCSICMALKHRSCTQIVYLAETVNKFFKEVDFHLLETKVAETIKRLESIKVTQKATLSNLEEDQEKCFKEIDDHHCHLVGLFDQFVKASKDSVKETFENLRSEIKQNFQNVEECIFNLENNKLQLQNKSNNDVQKFITVKKCHSQLRTSHKVSADAVNSVQVKGIAVSMDKRLETLLSKLQTLVTVVRQAPYKDIRQKKVYVSVKEDKSVCDIHGACILTDGSVLLADWSNKRIKRLDSSALSITEHCELMENPIDVCSVGDDKAAVTFGNKTVGLFTVKPSLAATQTFTLSHHCGYVAYSEGQLFITDTSNGLYIYSMDGMLVKTVETGPSGEDMFSRTRHVTVGCNGERVFVADMDRGLFSLDKELKAVVGLSDLVTGAYGVCTDGGAGLFLCGSTSNNVVHVDPQGWQPSTMLNVVDGLRYPRSLCYEPSQRKIFISQAACNEVLIYEL